MENMIYTLFVSVFVPLLFMALLVEKKARLPIAFMLVGIFVSLLASEVNGLACKLLPMSIFDITTIVTPMTEEILKALPILLCAILISDKRETLFTAAMATGIGFAVLENAYSLLNSPAFQLLDAVIRAFGTGLMHGMCTLLVGVGISFAQKKRKVFAVGTFALLATAIIYHGIYNMLVQSSYKLVGFLLPIATYMPFLVWRIKFKKKKTNDSQVA